MAYVLSGDQWFELNDEVVAELPSAPAAFLYLVFLSRIDGPRRLRFKTDATCYGKRAASEAMGGLLRKRARLVQDRRDRDQDRDRSGRGQDRSGQDQARSGQDQDRSVRDQDKGVRDQDVRDQDRVGRL